MGYEMNVTFPGLVPPAREICQVVSRMLFFIEVHLWGACVAQQTLNGS